MKNEKEILKKFESFKKEYSWINKCKEEGSLGQKVGCMARESREKTIERLKNQIEILNINRFCV